MIGKKNKKKQVMEEKVLDVDASIQGNVVFKDPVNLKINGKFEGGLTTKGNLTIGDSADIRADIVGESIIVAGKVSGDIIAQKDLKLIPPAKLTGNIKTPKLEINEGAVLNGNCQMVFDESEITKMEAKPQKKFLSADEVASYLEVEPSLIVEWANSGRLRGRKENGAWRFEQLAIDEWIKDGKVK